MSTATESVLQRLHSQALESRTAVSTDQQLLERYRLGDDHDAFEMLVRRHGTMVLGVCRRVLGDGHLAEDAFQATFLALLNTTASKRWRDSVAGWLHRVAYRIATKAKVVRARMPSSPMEDLPSTSRPADEPTWREVCSVLDREVQDLPERYRLPVLLCYFEGRSNSEAARELGCSKGTLSGRLSRARQILRGKLESRGIDSRALAPMLLVPDIGSAVPQALLRATSTLPLTARTALSASVIELAKLGSAPTMFAKIGALALLTLTLAFVGFSSKTGPRQRAHGQQPVRAAQQPPVAKERPKQDKPIPRLPNVALQKFLFDHGETEPATRQAIEKGLNYLALRQQADGSWKFGGKNVSTYPEAATSMSLLAFFGAGFTFDGKKKDLPHSATIRRGLQYLLRKQDAQGRFKGFLYVQGLATTALAQAYALSGDPVLKRRVQLAVTHVITAQHQAGGWRYTPNQPGDTSVTIWQVMALYHARLAGIAVPKNSLHLADKYFDSCRDRRGGYGYTQRRATRTMSAAGLLGRWYLGRHRWHPDTTVDVGALLRLIPPAPARDTYSDFYTATALYHTDKEAWRKLYPKLQQRLVKQQRADGSWPSNGDKQGQVLGPVLTTSFALLTLETPFREEWFAARSAKGELTPDKLEELGKALAGSDQPASQKAIWRLALTPGAIEMFEKVHKLVPRPIDKKAIARAIDELDDDEFATREDATLRLEKMGLQVLPTIRETLKKDLTPESRRRLERIRDSIERIEQDVQLRHVRLLEAKALREALRGSREK